MPSPYATALAVLRRVQQGLTEAVSQDEREYLLALHDDTLRILEASADRRRLSTAALAERVAYLDEQMRAWPADERQRAICERLGISRAWYYRIRQSTKP